MSLTRLGVGVPTCLLVAGLAIVAYCWFLVPRCSPTPFLKTSTDASTKGLPGIAARPSDEVRLNEGSVPNNSSQVWLCPPHSNLTLTLTPTQL